MELVPSWVTTLLDSYPSGSLPAGTLIAYSGSPGAGEDPQLSRAVVGLVEKSWTNPLFYPEGGYPTELLKDSDFYLPANHKQSLQWAFSQARGLYSENRLFGFVLIANDNGTLIGGSRNRWVALADLSMGQLLGSEPVHYYKSDGSRHAYTQQLLPTRLSPSSGINEFTLDVLAANTYNQYADVAVFIVPDDSLHVGGDGVTLDLTDYRLAPLPVDLAGLPLVVSSSHGGGSSMKQQTDEDEIGLWPDPPTLPASYSNQDNTGLVLTLSAGDQVAGIDFSDTGAEAQPLTFNTWPSSSSLFLTVGGSSYQTDADNAIVGQAAWRNPTSTGKAGASMEGGNGGFTAAEAIPAYQQISPWIQQFQQTALASSLNNAWIPAGQQTLFNWWNAQGNPLKLANEKRPFVFRQGESRDSEPLSVNPTLSRQMPDLANLASSSDFLSIHLNSGELDLTKPDWPSGLAWKNNGGTSLAAPATAALLAAVNVKRRIRGLADLSATEVHYLLYQLPPALLSDITTLERQPASGNTAYGAYPGYDFASGLGSVGGPDPAALVDTLAGLSMPLMPEVPAELADVIFKPGSLPLLLNRLQGSSESLQLVQMNGYAVNAVLQAARQQPERLQTDLLGLLAEAVARTKGSANAAAYTFRPLSSRWQSAASTSVVNQPLGDFLASEGIAVDPASLINLGSLADIFSSGPSAAAGGMPAFYALVDTPPDGSGRSLVLNPLQPNQGALLRQGAQLQTPDQSRAASLVVSTLQRPLLQADVAAALGTSPAAAALMEINLVLRSAASYANLYGLYPVDGADGSILDPSNGDRVLPSDPRYANLAIRAAFGDGSSSLLWEAPNRGTSTFSTSQNWSGGQASRDSTPLASILRPGGLYQHFIITAKTAAERQQLVSNLLKRGGVPTPAVLQRTLFALPQANRDGQNHVSAISDPGTLLSLGFEDTPDLGDRDYNDVIASWTVGDGSFGIGSTSIADLRADRIPDLAVGSLAGSPSTVVVLETNSSETLSVWQPFGASDWSGVNLAAGDVNGDGFDDLVAVRQSLPNGSSPAAGNEVMVLLGAADLPQTSPATLSFSAFGGAAMGPLSIAVRDLDLDGYAEVVLSATKPDATRQAVALEVWSMQNGEWQRRQDLLLPATTGLDPTHGYGVALGDLEGDGIVELILGDLQGADLFVGSIVLEGPAPSSTILQPYGKEHRSGIQPTAISARQTLVHRPEGLSPDALPWTLSPTQGTRQSLLAGLGTPGSLIVQSADPRNPMPAEVKLGSAGSDASTLIPIPWGSRLGAPVFSSGGVSYPSQPANRPKLDPIDDSPQPVLVAAAAGATNLALLGGPRQTADNGAAGSWQTISNTANSVFTNAQANLAGWTNPWGANTGGNDDAIEARYHFSQVTPALVNYTPPFKVNLNPLKLTQPQLLIADLAGHIPSIIDAVVQPWNSDNLKPGDKPPPWGPGAPNSKIAPYGPDQKPGLPDFRPDFSTDPVSGATTEQLVQQFQQRLITTAMASLGINYQHHHNPFWYSPQSWTPAQTPTPQMTYTASPEGRQTQGMDCSNFSSWNYNTAFGFWLNSGIVEQAEQTSVQVDWLTGGPQTLQANIVTTAQELYSNRTPDQIIDYLNKTLLPGDLLFLSRNDVSADPASATPADATHVITWLNNNSDTSSLQFVSLPDSSGSASPTPKPAFIIDSTGSESNNFLDQAYPNGVQIRQFDQNAWYVTNILTVHRWLTPGNVETMAASLVS